VFSKHYAQNYPESFDPALDQDVVYTGGLKLTDSWKDAPIDAGKLVLSPTRTYLPLAKEILKNMPREEIGAFIHCSGGAQTKVKHFMDEPVEVIKNNLFPIPPLFDMIQAQSHTDWKEMYQVFNMGHRLEMYVDEKQADTLIQMGKSFGIDTQVVGEVVASNTKAVRIESTEGTFIY